MRRTAIFSSCQFSLSLLLPCDSLFLRSKIIVSQSTAAYTSKRKVEQLIILEAVNNNEIVEAVIHDVGGGHHLKTFPDRNILLDACADNKAFKTFAEYISLVLQGERKVCQLPS